MDDLDLLTYIGVSPTAAADVIALLTDDDGDIALDGVRSSDVHAQSHHRHHSS